MKMPLRRAITFVLLVVALILAAGSVVAGDLIILHTNDGHGRLESHTPRGAEFEQGGLVRLASVVDMYIELFREERILLLDAGDTLHGTNIVNLFGGQPAIEVMNYMGYHVMALGNHDFNFGQDVLLERMEDAHFPMLAANVLYEDGRAFAVGAMIQEINGIRIGIMGLVAEDTPVVTHPANVEGLQFLSPVEIGTIMAERLKGAHGVDLLIALTHVGYGVDRELALAAPDIDLIVGGHSHTELDTGAVVNGVLIVQAHEYYNQLGVVQLSMADSALTDFEAKLVPVTHTVPIHPGVQSIIDEWNVVMEAQLGKIVAGTGVAWNGEREYVRTGETNLGNLVADVMRVSAGADIALTNGGGIRASILPGDITVGEVYTTLPFDNTLVVLELTGAELKQALEYSVRLYPEQNGGFMQVSGISFDVLTGVPAGRRVQNLKVHGERVHPQATYTMATNDFLAAGGDGYELFLDVPLVADTGMMLRDVMVEYLQERKIVTEPEGGRINILD